MLSITAAILILAVAGCQTNSKSGQPGTHVPAAADSIHIAGTLLSQSWTAKYGIGAVPAYDPRMLYLKFSDGASGTHFECDETGTQVEVDTLPKPPSSAPTGRISLHIPAVVGVATKANMQDAEAAYITTVSNYKTSNPDFRVQLTSLSASTATGTIQLTDASGTNLNGNFSLRICRQR